MRGFAEGLYLTPSTSLRASLPSPNGASGSRLSSGWFRRRGNQFGEGVLKRVAAPLSAGDSLLDLT